MLGEVHKETVLPLDINEELELFVSEADRLISKSFFKVFKDTDVCFSDDQNIDTSPSEDQTEAYVLHLRKFFQKSERVSIVKINEFIKSRLSENDPVFVEWNKYYTCITEMMASNSLINRVRIPELNGCSEIDIEQLFKAKIYGDLFHLDKAKRNKLSQLTLNPIKESMFRFEYMNFLSESGELINELSCICKKILAEQEQST